MNVLQHIKDKEQHVVHISELTSVVIFDVRTQIKNFHFLHARVFLAAAECQSRSFECNHSRTVAVVAPYVTVTSLKPDITVSH